MIRPTHISLLVALLAMALTACNDVCVGPVDCPAQPNVTYEYCNGGEHIFSDGTDVSSKQEVIDYCFCTPLRCTNGDTAQLCSELHNEPFDQPRRTFENDRDYLYDYPGENSVLIGEGVFTIARGLDVCLGAADCSSASEPNSDGTRTYFCADDRQVRSGVPATRERCVNVVDCTAITNEQSCTRNLRCRYSFSSRSCVPDVDCNVPQSACVIRAGCMWQVTPIEQ